MNCAVDLISKVYSAYFNSHSVLLKFPVLISHSPLKKVSILLSTDKFPVELVMYATDPGAWSDSPKVRGSAVPYTEEFKECVALQAQYIFDTYGKFPGTIQSIFCFMYVQAQHLDLDFYDHHFKPGAYLTTHEEHMIKWH